MPNHMLQQHRKRCVRLGQSKRRRHLSEALERRLVLSGAHDAALLAAIDGALLPSNASGMAAWASKLDDPSAMGRNLPLAAAGLGTAYDPGAALKSLLNRLAPTYGSLASLVAGLEGSPGLADGVAVTASRDNPDNLELDVHFNTTTGFQMPVAGQYGINLGVTGSLSLNATLDFQLTIGAYWDTSTSSAVFYVLDTNDALQISTSTANTSLNATGSLGVVDLAVTGGSASLSPTFAFSLIDQNTPSQPGRVTLPELTSTPVPALVATTATQAGPTTFTVNFNAPLAPTAHVLTIDWGDLTKPNTATSTLNTDPTLSQLAAYQNILPTTYSLGLDNLVQILTEATTTNLGGNNPFMATLPLLNTSFGTVLNVQQLLTNALTNHTDATTNAQNQQVLAFSTIGQLLTLLQNLPGVGAAHASMTASAGDIRFTLSLPASSNQNLPLTLGIASQLNLPVTGSMSVAMTTTTNVTFGVNTANQFFLVDTGSPVLNASLSATATLGGNTTLGFLGVTITGGMAGITGTATLALKDPQTDNPPTPGIISSTEMTGANLNAMAVPGVSGTATASLPLTTNLPALAAVSGTLGVSWANITQAQTFTLSDAALTQYLGFNNLTSTAVLNGLGALPAVLNHAGDTAFLGENLAFVGSSLGSGITLGTQFQNIVNGLASINTAQDLQNALNSALGAANVAVSLTANDIEFGLTETQTIPGSLKWAVNVTEPGSGDGFQSTGTVAATGTYTAKMLVGLSLQNGVAATDQFYLIPGAGSSLSAGFKVQQTSTVNAGASLGYLQVNIAGGSATITSAANAANNATVSLPFIVPGGSGTQITLTKLQANPPTSALGTPTTDGKAQVVFPLTGLPSPGSGPQITIAWADISKPGTVVVTPQNLGDLSPGSNYSAADATAGIQAVITMINGWANLPLLNTNIPLVGSALKSVFDFISKGTSFFQAIVSAGDSTPAAFDSAVQGAIAKAGLDAGSVTLTPQADNNPSTATFHYLLNFHYNVAGISEPFNFGGNLFTLNGNVNVGVQFNANLEFGLDKSNGFYLVDRSTAANPEISLSAGITANFNKIGGNFGPVSYGVSNGTGNVTFNMGLDLVSPQGTGGKIGPGDLANNISAVVQPEFLAGSGAKVDLPIGFYLGNGGPGVATEFKAHWDPTHPDAFYFGTGNSTDPADGFSPVQFELGDFISGIIGPLLQNVQQYDPLPQKLVDLLNYQLPLINETPAQILGDVTGIPGFALLFKIANVINELSSLTGGGTLNLSSYLSTAPNTGTAPSQAGQGGTPAEQSPFQSFLSDLQNNYGITIPVLANPTSSIINILLGKDVTLIEFKPGDNGHVEVSASLTSPSITVPIFSIGFADASVTADIGGSVGFFANIDLGINSSGLTGHNIDHSSNLLDGFFVGNQDRFQVGFEGQVFLDLGGQVDIFGIPIVTVYGRLGLQLDLGLHFNDVRYVSPGSTTPVAPPNGEVGYGETGGDGQVTLDEIKYLVGTYGLPCALELGGQLSLFGGIGFKGPDIPLIGPIPNIYKQLGTIPIINFDIGCTPPPPQTLANIVGNSLVMVPDSGTAGKHVEVNIYYNAQEQPQGITFVKYDDNGTLNQSFDFATLSNAGVTNLVVEGTNGPDVIRIDPMVTSDYNFQHITVNTHNGDDTVQFGSINQQTSHLLGTTINAGDGNDNITGTFRPDSITTGNGNDNILGLMGDDSITVGNGKDTVQGGTGNDLINTGGGQSEVHLGDGNNTVFVGNGGNLITSGNGNNTVTGGSGGDKYHMGDGANHIMAGDGPDVIYVGQGNNYVSTGAGNDVVFAGDGNNTIGGGSGNDQLNAGMGNNDIYGQGNNTIKTGNGKNYVSAGPGNNIVLLGNGDNKVVAGNGANLITTGHGQDIILAGNGPDTVNTGAGDDFISVGPGNDQINGGGGNNMLEISADGNFVLTGLSTTVTTASGQGVVTYSQIRNVTLTGGPGNNTFDVSAWPGGQPGSVVINGNGGTDTIISNNDTDFTLTDSSLRRSDGTSFLLNGISQAQLTGGPSDNSFDVSTFSGPVAIDGGAGVNDYNRIIDTAPGTYTLTDASLVRSTGATVTLARINRATLPGGASTVNSGGFSGLVDLTPGTSPAGTLNSATDSYGRWVELGQSASNGGVSNSPDSALDPSIATTSTAQFIAWADNRSGTYEIYVAERAAGAWTQLAGSAQGGGISNTAGNSRRPSITVDGSGNPIVAWTVFNGSSTDIEVATYSPTANAGAGGWVAMGSSLGAGGISGTGAADHAQIVYTAAGPVVAWLDSSGGPANVFVKQFAGGLWSALGTGAAGGAGVSGSGVAVPDFSLATDGTKVAVSWTHGPSGSSQIYLEQFASGLWSAVGQSASGNGLSNTPGSADQSSVAYYNGALFVAWQATVNNPTISSNESDIAAATSGGGNWSPVSIDTPGSAGNSVTRGAASLPQLAQAGGTLELVWLERRLAGVPSQDTEIYANRFNGSVFARVLPGDASFNGIHWTSSVISTLALSVDSIGRPFVAWGDGSTGGPQIYALGTSFAIHNIYYVNDAKSLDDSFTTAAGSSTNSGTSPASPLDSVQSVLGKYSLAAGDVILVDSGAYSGFTLSGAPSGVLITGPSGVPATFIGAVMLTNVQGVILQGLSMTGGLTLTNCTNVEIANDSASSLTLSGGSGDRVDHSALATLTINGNPTNATFVNNTVSGAVTLSGSTNLVMIGNYMSGGLTVSTPSAGTITGNHISGGPTALNLATQFTGSIDHNAIFGSNIGVTYATPALLNVNRIYNNNTGVVDSVNSLTGGLGFVAGSVGNEIFNNYVTGVNLTGLMQLQHVHNDSTGVTGSGTLGSTTLDNANLIEMNYTGTNFTGTIQFNRIARNNVGIQATNGQIVIHNLIYRNLTAGIDTGGANDVRIINNTFYSTSGNNIQVDGGSSNVQALNNIMWTTAGYDLYVADNSRAGFFSDYNDLFSTGTGKLVHWLLDFIDILDWQVTLNRLDLHSIGTTVINPTWAQPQFVNLARDNFSILPLVNGIRASSPTLDTADPVTDIGQPGSYVNLLANPSFESGVTSWIVNVGGGTQSANPAPFNGSNYFYSGAVGSGFAQQTISLTGAGFTAAQLDGQGLVAVFGGRVRSAAETPVDQGQIVFTFLNGSGVAIGAPDTVPASNASDRWELIGDRLHIPVGARSVTYRFQSLRQTGSTDDSYLDNAFVYVLPSTTAPDMGAYGNTSSDTDLQSAHVHINYPDLYVDWELSTPHNIQWSTFGAAGSPVNIDLYQDTAGTPQFLMHIASSVADTGQYTWIPLNSGLTYGMYGLRLQVSLATNPSVYDRSTEAFTIPENGHSYYINDASQTGDVYTTAVGSNRNDGKLPGKPKPLLTSLLRIYNLGGADTIFVDTGTYYHFDPVILSGNPLVGKNQGVTITGPANPANVAQINTLGFTSPAVFDINNGNFVILTHLAINGGDYGVWARNISTNFTGTYLTLTHNGLDGIRLESDSSTNAVLDHIVSASNGRDGISIGGTGINLTNSIAHNNGNAGIRYDNSGPVVVTGNQSYLNKYGLYMLNSTGNAAMVGNTDLTKNLGNIVHDNSSYGIYANGVIAVAGNTVFDTAAPGGAGPATLTLSAPIPDPNPTPPPYTYFLSGQTYYYRVTAVTPAGETLATPEESVAVPGGHYAEGLSWPAVPGALYYNVYRGYSGGETFVSTASGAGFLDMGTIYGGTAFPGTGTVGINLQAGASATENVVYTNYRGIYSNSGGSAGITNNRVFDTAGTGIYAANSTSVTGNVIYSNIVGLEGDSAAGSTHNWSNNLIYADNVDAIAGIWLHNGFSANIFNNTVYLTTGDGIRIESSGGNFSFQHVNIRNNIVWTQSGTDLTVTPQAEINFQSDYNDFFVSGNGRVGLWEGVARPTLQAWRLAGYTDFNSISANPQFVNPAGADGKLGFTSYADFGSDDDFHEQSIAGSFHGGSLAPVISATTGLPTALVPTLTPDESNSPALDRGDAASSFANEPSPNGGFINLGTYGNTAQASESTIPYVLVLSPNGGETIIESETFTVTWRSEVTTGTASIDLMSGNSVVQNIANGVPNSGSYAWSVPASIAPGSYTIRISRTSPSPSSGISAASFNIVGPVHTFYVNDGTFQAGDFTTAAGDDANNSGLDPADPKASIRAILQAYNLLPGDVIDVDAGNYMLSNNIVVPATRSGIIIRGFYDPANPTHVAIINRNSTTAGSYVFDIQGATNVTLDHLTLVGGDIGVNLADNATATGFTLSNSEVYGSATDGVYVGIANNGAVISGNRIHDVAAGYRPTAIYVDNAQATVSNNVVYNEQFYGIDVSPGHSSTVTGNTAYNSGTGIYADTATISGNIAYNNPSAGIVVGGGASATGNTTYNDTGSGGYPQAGIQVYGGTVQGNISYANVYGIYVSGSGTITGNLLYNNTTDGAAFGNSTVFNANVVYGNGWGVVINSAPNAAARGPSLSNDLIYGNTSGGISLNGGDITPIDNNTIYQTTGDAIDVTGAPYSTQVDIRNNILWATTGYALHVDSSAQSGITADFNDLYATGTGKIGFWQNVAYTSLATWQLASLEDADSISTDPLFVNAAAGDFHEQSLYGSFHGGSLAPVLNVATGLPVPATATLTNDASQSPAIDRGDATFAYANEPAPNGGYINLGAYGNTTQASKSPTAYVIVTQPSGGQTWIEGQTYTITWRDANIGTGLVNIDLMTFSGNTATPQSNIVTGAANSGHYSWAPSASIPPASNYLIQVTQQGGSSALSPAVFSLAAPVHTYYVNDATVQAGDWTTAPGNDANSGLDPAHPKASIASVIANYNLGALDTIMVDAGTYNLAGDITLLPAVSGLTIEGYNSATYPTRKAILNRGNTTSGACFTLDGAANVTIDHLGLTGGLYGFQSTYQVASNNATVSNCEINGNSSNAVYLIGGANNFTITNCSIHNDDQGITSSYNTNMTITNNTIYSLRLRGISISGSGGTVSGNTVTGVTGVAAIEVYGGSGTLFTVSNNISHDNTTTGLIVGSYVLATGNTTYNQAPSNDGIDVAGGEARGNLSYNNYHGIYVSSGLADQNKVYNNSYEGIYVGSGTVTQNQVYSNPTGIEGNASPTISNNLIYANTTRGIYITTGVAAQVINNTVYQPTGDAVDLLSSEGNFQFQHMQVRDNILWTQTGYDLNLSDDAAIGFSSDYNDLYVTGAGKVARISNRDYPALADWVYEYGYDAHSISADPNFVNVAASNFHLLPASPAIDAGDPTLPYFNEPAPNGGRINLGNFGNTTQADPSPATQSVQVTAPSNLQKMEDGHQYTLSWQTAGVTANQPVLLVDTGGPAVGYWTADAFSTTSDNSRTVTNAIDTSGVSNPAPQQVYQSYVWPSSGSELAYQLPVPDGNYTLRLHFMDEPPYIGKPVMNIKVNGVVVKSAYDLFASAGAAYKATALSFNVAASGGTGLKVEVVSVSGSPVLSGIELSAPNPTPVPSPAANLQVSTDSGNTWSTIATNQPIDAFGRGSFPWTPAVTTSGPTALFRVSINNTSLTGTSPPFAIYNGGTDYYVNDASQTGDAITTAVGNNANSGKSPNVPLADIQAVLTQYNPGAGATIHVDTGTYVLVHTITLTAVNSGLKIQGPTTAAAVINRANTADPVISLTSGANNITLDHLSITGGSYGIFSDYYSAGTSAINNVVSNNQIYANNPTGLFLGSSNTGWLITGNTFHDNTNGSNQGKGIDLESSPGTVTSNKIFNESQIGILVSSGAGSTVSGNEIYASGVGIQASGALTITNNLVHDNSTYGIYAISGALATGNTVYRQIASNAAGIYLQSAEARGNTVYYNYNGIATINSTNTIDRNDVYSNTNFGILISGSNGGTIENLVYANSAAGVVLTSSSGEQIANNTVYQLVGDALRFTGSPNASIHSNILWVEAGDDLDVTDAASQAGLVSDYNDLYRGPGASAHVGFWGAIQDQLANWQAASAKDAGSISANPQFLNAKGADQVLGYNTAGSGYNGGVDDNFYLAAGSPAIDRGYTWAGYNTDILNQPRADDPGTTNAGSNNYVPADQGSSQYAVTGTATGWRSSSGY
ncbi:MAG: right-handed parallel beta-helix repeat-containing protein, partial [Tepidisphaerales bacterium]